MNSSVLYTPVLEQIIPSFRKEAPLERKVGDQSYVVLSEKNHGQLRKRFQEHCDTGH